MKKIIVATTLLVALALGACKVQVGDVKNGNQKDTTTTTQPAQ